MKLIDMQQPAPTRMESTEQRYEQVIARFRKLAQQELATGRADLATPEPLRMAALFLANEPDWAAATARQYRAALVYGFRQSEETAAAEALAMLYHMDEDDEDGMLRRMAMQEARRQRKKTQPVGSQQKAKRFSNSQLDSLIAALHASRSQWAGATIDWLVAGMLTGLRPGEWRQAELTREEGQPALRIVNAKATNGRALGPCRTLLLGDLDEWQRATITRHLVNVKNFAAGGRYQYLYEGCRQLVRDVADRIFPSRNHHPTLYTARHMFAANAKSVYGKTEVAALMGHGSIDTAGCHYAERWSASGAVSVRPSRADVASVMKKNLSVASDPDKKPG